MLFLSPLVSFGATYNMVHSQQVMPANTPLGVYSRDNGIYINALYLRFNHSTASGVDITTVLHSIQLGDIIKITDINGNYYTWLVTGSPTHNSNYENVPVSFIELVGVDTVFMGYTADPVTIDFDYTPPALPQTNTLSDITSSATSTFATATGIEYTELTAWSGSMIAMVLGSGLGVLSALMPWIIAIMVVMGIVGFLYAGFRFFRH